MDINSFCLFLSTVSDVEKMRLARECMYEARMYMRTDIAHCQQYTDSHGIALSEDWAVAYLQWKS